MYLEFEPNPSPSHRGGRARDHLRNIDVMIKWARSHGQLRALINEWRLLHELPFGSFARPVEFRSLPDGSAYLATEWLSGRPFDSFCNEADEGQLATVVRKALDGLAIMHRAGFVHGDVRPQNILVISAPGSVEVRWVDLEHAACFADPNTRRSYVAGWNHPVIERGQGQTPATELYGLGLMIAQAIEHRRRSRLESPKSLGEFASTLLHQNPLDPIHDAVEASTRFDRMLEAALSGPVSSRAPVPAWRVINRRAQAAWMSNWPRWSRSGLRAMISVHGPEGCGKTTFLRAASAEAALDGCQVLNLIDWASSYKCKNDSLTWGTRLADFIRSHGPDPTLLLLPAAAWEEFQTLHEQYLLPPVVVIAEGREPSFTNAPAGWNFHEWAFPPFSDREWYEWVIASI